MNVFFGLDLGGVCNPGVLCKGSHPSEANALGNTKFHSPKQKALIGFKSSNGTWMKFVTHQETARYRIVSGFLGNTLHSSRFNISPEWQSI